MSSLFALYRGGRKMIDMTAYRDMDAYYADLGAAYAKAPLVLCQLEAMVGRPVMEETLRTYAKEYAFKHPTRQDFRRVAERVSGRDLGAFWRDSGSADMAPPKEMDECLP